MKNYDLAVIGASVAGLSAIDAYTAEKPGASVVLINGEDRLPYKRTKLTKNIYKGFAKEAFSLHSETWYGEHHISLINGKQAVAVNPDEHTIVLSDDSVISFQSLIIATGATPVKLPWQNIFYIRSALETERFIDAAAYATSAAVIGSGVQGIEIAEQLTLLGKKVTLIGKSKALLPKWFDAEMSSRLIQLCKANNIHMLLNKAVSNVTGQSPVIIEFSDGTSTTADIVAASIGIKPLNTLTASIALDKYLETEYPNIYIAGDAAGIFTYDSYGLWHGAEYSGQIAGKNAAGKKTPFVPVSYRLKCEVFDSFFFSMHYTSDDESVVVVNTSHEYLRVYVRNNSAVGALFFSDNRAKAKPFSKILQKAIQNKVDTTHIKNLYIDALS